VPRDEQRNQKTALGKTALDMRRFAFVILIFAVGTGVGI
jgi:hypothetical protein